MAGGRKILSEQDCSELEMQESSVEIQRLTPGCWLLDSLSCEAMVDVAIPKKALQLGLPDLANENTGHPHLAGSILKKFVVYLQFKLN